MLFRLYAIVAGITLIVEHLARSGAEEKIAVAIGSADKKDHAHSSLVVRIPTGISRT